MTINYDTNWMGPISTNWYKENGFVEKKVIHVASDSLSRALKKPLGTRFEVEDITEYWCGGRIDIYGVPGEHYPIEYALPIMHSESWNILTNWLEDFESDELLTFDDLINTFETDTGHKIRWFKKNE